MKKEYTHYYKGQPVTLQHHDTILLDLSGLDLDKVSRYTETNTSSGTIIAHRGFSFYEVNKELYDNLKMAKIANDSSNLNNLFYYLDTNNHFHPHLLRDEILVELSSESDLSKVLAEVQGVSEIEHFMHIVLLKCPIEIIDDKINELRNLECVIDAHINYHAPGAVDTELTTLSTYSEKEPLIEFLAYKELNFKHENFRKIKGESIICLLDNGVIKHDDLTTSHMETKSLDVLNKITNQTPIRGDLHGTHCAGILAASSEEPSGLNGLGVGSKLISVKIAEGKNFSSTYNRKLSNYHIIKGLLISAYKFRASVINCSWNLPFESGIFENVIELIVNDGIPIVMAAGNYKRPIIFPATLKSLIVVSAVDDLGLPIQDYCYGENVFLSALGYSIPTTDIPGIYGGTPIYKSVGGSNKYYYKNHTYFSGTSAACCVISAAISQILRKNNKLNLNEIKEILLASSIEFQTQELQKKYGYGYICFDKLYTNITNL